jgi:hypothetical protein
VDPKLSATDHIAAMKKFLESGPKGKRFIDFSWSRFGAPATRGKGADSRRCRA